MWSDPDADITGWAENDRGVSYTFGADVVSKFLQKHDFDLVVRAHQVVEDGYEFFADRQLVTIFTAPNYCGEFDNAGAVHAFAASSPSLLGAKGSAPHTVPNLPLRAGDGSGREPDVLLSHPEAGGQEKVRVWWHGEWATAHATPEAVRGSMPTMKSRRAARVAPSPLRARPLRLPGPVPVVV